MKDTRSVSVLIIGAGFSGIAIGASLLRAGIDDFLIVDRGQDFGGTWHNNTYPGAECDIQSHLYSFSFSPNPSWSKTYAPQPEIQCYLREVAHREQIVDKTVFGVNVDAMTWNEARGVWIVTASGLEIEARVLVPATGHLSDPKLPRHDGDERFEGKVFHSATWDHDYDFRGKRVAVVGTGASAIQVVPAIADRVSKLVVFQRSAPYVVPRHDTVYSDEQKATFARAPESAAQLREFLFWSNENRFLQRMMVPQHLAEIDRVAADHRQAQVSDPVLLAKVTPDYTIGCKRILHSNTWYPTLSRDHVELVTQPFTGFSEAGPRDAEGNEYEVDCVIFCSGFEAAELPIARRIQGADSTRLHEVWAQGSEALGGMTVPGFPNMYLMNGPHVGLGAGSIIFMIETQAQYITEGIAFILESPARIADAKPAALGSFIEHLGRRASGTVWTEGNCRSWYLDERSGRLTTIWPDQMNRFHARFAKFDPEDYVVLDRAQLETV
jgi:cation diffusion facilitator CzcD-associated flavoprotein CzcO